MKFVRDRRLLHVFLLITATSTLSAWAGTTEANSAPLTR